MNNQELHDGIKQAFKTTFPDGWIDSGVGCGQTGGLIYIEFGLVGDRTQLTSNILDNDPCHHKFLIFADTSILECKDLVSGISVNPKDKYLAMSHVKTKYRKTTGDHARILKSFITFFDRLQKLVIENEHDIYQRSKYDDKFFTFEG